MRPSFDQNQRRDEAPIPFGFRERAPADQVRVFLPLSPYLSINQERSAYSDFPSFSAPRYPAFSRRPFENFRSGASQLSGDTTRGRRPGQRNFHTYMDNEFLGSEGLDDMFPYPMSSSTATNHPQRQRGMFSSTLQNSPNSPGAQSSSSFSSLSPHVDLGRTAAGASFGLSTTSPSSSSMPRNLNLSLSASKDSRMGEDGRKETITTASATMVEFKKDAKPDECCICQEILLSDLVALVPCGHVMHGECARQCVQHGRKCPQCRAKMNMRDPFVKLYLDVSSYASSGASDVVLANRLKSMETLLEARQKDLTAAEDKYQVLLNEHQLDVIEKERCAAQLKEMHDKYSTNIKSEHKVRMEMKAMEDAYHGAVKEKEDAVQAKVNLEKKIHHLEVALDNKDGEVNRLRKQLEEQMCKNQSIESLREKRASQDKLILELGEKLRLQLVENNQLSARLASNTNGNHESAARGGGFDISRNHSQQQKLHDFNSFRKRTYGEVNNDFSGTYTPGQMENHHYATFEPSFYHDEEASFEMTKRMSTPSSSSSTAFVETGAAKKLKLVPGTIKITQTALTQQPRPGMQLTMKQMFSKRN